MEPGGGGLVHFWVNVPNVVCQMSPVTIFCNIHVNFKIGPVYIVACRFQGMAHMHVMSLSPHVDWLHVAY